MALGKWGGLGIWGGENNPSIADIDFDLESIEFRVTGSATLPQPSADISFDVEEVEFSVTGSSTLPNTSASIYFDIPEIEFSMTGSVSGVSLPPGEIIFPNTKSNVIILY